MRGSFWRVGCGDGGRQGFVGCLVCGEVEKWSLGWVGFRLVKRAFSCVGLEWVEWEPRGLYYRLLL